jgi:hypothetical protein
VDAQAKAMPVPVAMKRQEQTAYKVQWAPICPVPSYYFDLEHLSASRMELGARICLLQRTILRCQFGPIECFFCLSVICRVHNLPTGTCTAALAPAISDPVYVSRRYLAGG